ncbi:hypothetical protein [Streptomyces sp. 7N604]|uniref:hypothetical protein n=1 Tax=Streptomyces sp. 7N604 TaxID=3457415 RepID=UPI003FD5B6EB
MTADFNATVPDEWEALADVVLGMGGAVYGKVAMVLGICLSADREDLLELAGELWSGENSEPEEPEELEAAVDSLLKAPFVEETASGWRINESLAPRLAARFMRDDEDVFRRAHRILAERETRAISELELLDQQDDDTFAQMERWFVQSRLAFYLAGVHAGESAQKFGEAFESAPYRDLSAARMWLSTLALRQAPLLEEHARVIEFFQGFRAYVAGRRDEAALHFSTVIQDDITDLYQAIALHLHAMCAGDAASRIEKLNKSIQVSEQLGLRENEIMARNSLVSAHFSQANKMNGGGKLTAARNHLRRAQELADVNRAQARLMRDEAYRIYTLTQYARAAWLLAAGVDGKAADSASARAVLPDVLDELAEAITISDRVGLSESALRSINQRASVLRDVGRTEEAVDELESSLHRIGPLTSSLPLRGLAKTAGSMKRNASPDVKRRIVKFHATLDRWLD